MKEQTQLCYVGIGASAGGLQALSDFFDAVPDDSKMVYVVIQHLSPNYESMMDELLARHTHIQIEMARDKMKIKANHIYLIPPKYDLTIYNDTLFLDPIDYGESLHLPIDKFFETLAADQGPHAAAVILSGTGSDGTKGIQAIKESGGYVLVQDQLSAQFDGMPQSAIRSGHVDDILEPYQMPAVLEEHFKHFKLTQEGPKGSKTINEGLDFVERVMRILREFTGIDLTSYKANTLLRRLDRRFAINKIDNHDDYLRLLKESDEEKELLYKEVFIGVTEFFRDEEVFKFVEEKIIPQLISGFEQLRIWIPACSTGEEAYSYAMLVREYFDRTQTIKEVKIFATDIDKRSLDKAAAGKYSATEVEGIPKELLAKNFEEVNGAFHVVEELRRMIVFAKHNLISDPPFSHMSMISCRNVFIYLKVEVQQKILSKFYFSLDKQGILVMGNSETVGDMKDAYETVDSKHKVFTKKEGHRHSYLDNLNDMGSYKSAIDKIDKTISQRRAATESLLLKVMSKSMRPSIILDEKEQIVQLIGPVSQFMKVKEGRFSNNLFTNFPEQLCAFITHTVRQVRSSGEKVIMRNLKYTIDNTAVAINLECVSVQERDKVFYSISFDRLEVEEEDEAIQIRMEDGSRIKQLEEELDIVKNNLSATVEEVETSNEELQSANEELIASNEELQSTNEELQSVNEELYTVNSEYQEKIHQLTELNNDLENLLNNIEVGAIYLDKNMRIRKVTPLVSKMTNIMASDLGRPIGHLSIFDYSYDIIKDIREVNKTLKIMEKEIVDKLGQYWLMRIRPYRTEYNSISGILITFIDMTSLKKQMNKTIIANERLEQIMNFAHVAWWEWDIKTGNVVCDDLKATMIGYHPNEFPNNVYEICDLIHPDDYEQTMQIMRDHLMGKTEIWDATYRIRTKSGAFKIYHDQGKVIEWNEKGEPVYAKGSVISVTDLEEAGE